MYHTTSIWLLVEHMIDKYLPNFKPLILIFASQEFTTHSAPLQLMKNAYFSCSDLTQSLDGCF